MLGAAQAVRFGGRIEEGLRPVLPSQPLQARLEDGGESAGRGGRHAAIPFDHDGADLGEARADKRDARRAVIARHVPDPFGARTGLAEAAPGADQPGAPDIFGAVLRRQLLVARPAFPVIAAESSQFVRGKLGGKRLAIRRAVRIHAPQP